MRSPLLPPRIFVHLPGGWWSSGVRTSDKHVNTLGFNFDVQPRIPHGYIQRIILYN